MSNQEDEKSPLEAEILREVAEEIKEEELKEFLKKIKPIVTAVIFVVLAFTAGFEFYKHSQKEKSLKESAELLTALTMMQEGQGEEASLILKELSEKSSRGYRYLASFHYVDYLLNQSEEEQIEALEVLERLSQDKKAPAPVRHLALFDKISLQIELGDGDFDAMQEEIDSLLNQSEAWTPLALELSALIALKQGDKQKAVSYWNQIIERPEVSEAKRKKISEFVTFINKTEEENIPSEE